MDGRAEIVPQVAVRQIQEMIRSGELPAGSRLPAQRELAAHLRVSRTSLREALSTLEALGVVRTEARRGTTVLGVASGGAVAPWRFASRAPASDFYQFRFVTEGYAARLAAMRAGVDDVGALLANGAAMKEALRMQDLIGVADLDIAFHTLIMAMSGNRVFLDLYSSYGAMVRQSQALPLANGPRRWEPITEHENVARAIEQHDPDGASYFMHLHIVRAAGRSGIALRDPA